MPLRLDVKKLLLNHSDRVKSVDLHPSEPWVLTSLYSGKVVIRNYETQQIVKSFDASELPVRTAKFVPRKRWVICGADDMQVRVYNYNTSEKEKQFEAHTDYIRCVAVHPSSPLILTSSDDLTIKLWNWEKNWQQVKVFEGHSHYIMQVLFSPKDPNVFASCSLDATIRMWNINSSSPNFTLEGHAKGINCIDFYHGADKPHLVSGSDDCKVKVWDYQTKSCIQTLEAHTHNVTSVCFHPKLPVLISGSEDQVVSIFNGNTYKLEETVNYGLERCWAMSYSTTDTKLALGYDAGTVVVKLGKEDPVISMDRKGKLLTANNNEISQISLKGLPEGVSDGEKISFPSKEVATCDVYPEKIEYDPKGRFVSVTGDGEYIIYAAVSFKNKTYGSAEDLVWGQESGTYAIREKSGGIKINKNFKQVKAFKKSFFIPQQIFGGNLLGVRSSDFICLYDWETLSLIRSIEVVPKQVYWNESGDYVALCCENSFYVLRYDESVVREALKSTQMTSSESLPEGEGITNCLELEEEIGEQVKDGQWIGDCFIYVSNANRLSYFIGGQTTVVAHLDKPYILIGYVEKYNRVYLMDYDRNIISYQLHISVIQYETAVVRGDLDAAGEIFPRVPEEFHNQLARFLDNQGQKELALTVSKDPEHQFDLAIALGKLNQALSIVEQGVVDDQKWKQLGSIALHQGDFKLSEECMWKGRDFNGLLLLFTSLGNREGLEKLAAETSKANKTNVAFTCYFYLQQVDNCIDLLLNSGRITEAAFFARTYAPSQVSRIVKLWRDDIKKVSEKASEALADPAEYPNLFPDFQFALQAEKKAQAEREQTTSASRYPELKDYNLRDLISLAKSSPEAAPEAISAPEAPVTQPAPEEAQNGAEEVQPAEPAAAEEAPVSQPEQPASETATKKKKKR